MPASILGTSGATFGLQEESGGLVRTVSRTPQVDTAELADGDGDIVDVALFKPRADFSVTVVKTSATGVGAPVVGASLTLVNALPDFGVTPGKKAILSVPTTGQAEDWLSHTINGREYPSIAP